MRRWHFFDTIEELMGEDYQHFKNKGVTK